MSINIGPPASDELRPRITVIGVGGAGGNAIANMIAAEIEGVDFIVANTDAQALNTSSAERRIQLGPDITGGLGAGARPEVGKAAAEETVSDIEEALEGVNMCFIAAGMGGGTGTGAAPVIAEAARRKGVLTVGVVTKPFLFEGTRRMRAAEAGIDELQRHVDTLIVIPNQNLFLVAKAETTFKEAFELADEVLQQGVRSITDLMVMPGLINLDFADVRSVMSEMGKAMMGTGEGEGENRALEAAERAIANPLLDGVSMAGAKGVIISIIGGEDMKLLEVDEAANHIRELVDEDANIIWGSAFNPDLSGRIRVSVVATGIEQGAAGAGSGSQPMSLAAARAPKRPVLELPAEDIAEEEFEDSYAEEDDVSESAATYVDESFVAPTPAPAMPSSYSSDDEDEYEEDDGDDVDGIVDPLAGLRNDEEDDWGDEEEAASAATPQPRKEPLDLSEAAEATNPQQDELLLDADRLAEADEPVQPAGGRRRGLVSGGGGGEAASGGASAGAGSTLFERMANLSRGSSSRDEEEEEEDEGDDNGPSLSIPRFLGRQNNQ
ncbi:MAG: cell division protein FtsZ [Sphingomonadales bacterium]|nr:cell division protein FtsZ [Sphingomonadales bacterium]MBD3773570.1 cell division protein FtsZ [Paracoccaceae bacterium]